MRRDLQLVATVTVALAAALAVLVDAPQPVRGIAGLLLVFVLPGVAVVAAVTHRRPWPAEHAVLATASSIATVILGGLALDLLPGGLSRVSWALFLAYATVVVVAAAALRRPPRKLRGARLRRRPLARPTTRQIVLMAAAAAIAVAAMGIAAASADDARRGTPIVQLWMLSSRGSNMTTLRIGVDAENARAAVYRLELRSGEGEPTVWQVPTEGSTRWRAIVEIPQGAPRQVDAVLLSEEDRSVIRRVRQRVS